LHILVARSAAEMDFLRPAWEHLYKSNLERLTFFQSFAWNRLAAAHFADREAPFVVMAESDSGLAIVPAAVAGRTRLTLLGESLFDYRDILTTGDSSALQQACWARLAELRLPLSVVALRGQSTSAHWEPFRRTPFCDAPLVSRAGTTSEAFALAHSRLGRNLRRLSQQGFELRARFGPEVRRVLEWLYGCKAERFVGTGNNIFGDQVRINFMSAASQIDVAPCEVFTLERGDDVAAALVTFCEFATRRFYSIHFDPRWGKNSPGTTLVYEITRRSLADGLDCDYMTGEQSYKNRLANAAVPLFRVEATAEAIRAAGHERLPLAA
jgi:CelD/BcsL family acetyltransferase involved in cellulose biosynthesis